MTPRGLLACISTICSVTAAAIPNPNPNPNPNSNPTSFTSSPEHSAYGSVISHSRSDPLWSKYGLNRSEEFKYFQEPGNDHILAHYDSRYFRHPVSEEERAKTLTQIIHAYFDYFRENDLETWLAHGTLLGWWWNGRIMPWDWDIDTQVSEATLFRLADEFNNTIVRIPTSDPNVQQSYLLDINPWARQRDHHEGLNIIDARWIDMQTGLYIDITGLSKLDPEKHPNQLQCKHDHKYQINDIYPLRMTSFEGVAAKVPFRYEAVLTDEYQETALTNMHYNDHTWIPELEEWVSDKELEELAKDKANGGIDGFVQEDTDGENLDDDDRQYE
ncbi:hypothetical protein ARAM_004044 [Aspergillus rambellii]|uniref:LicD/FKTN/FKRP nucleotidyltransferase domain-containing protein n=1 Tax=Aspergillus rambellii TaxID=308745 RepID=A0A0F8ULU5_9EURO|nr:hypothetical protein ARAM_004044 [Aspergillus rambellii]